MQVQLTQEEEGERSAGTRRDGQDTTAFTYEGVNYRDGCVDTYSLKGIGRRCKGSRDNATFIIHNGLCRTLTQPFNLFSPVLAGET